MSLRFTRGDGPVTDHKGTVDDIEDKAVQDVDNTEGTGVRTLKELSERHVGGPTIAAAHFLRVISADKNQRLDVANNVRIKQPSPVPNLSDGDKVAWAEKIRLATYGTVLAFFIQGCNLIARQSKSQKWGRMPNSSR